MYFSWHFYPLTFWIRNLMFSFCTSYPKLYSWVCSWCVSSAELLGPCLVAQAYLQVTSRSTSSVRVHEWTKAWTAHSLVVCGFIFTFPRRWERRNGGHFLKNCEVKWSKSRSFVSNSLWPHGLYSPWNSPGQNTGVGSLSLLQEIFPTQGLNPGLPHYRWILYQLSHKGSPKILECVVYPFPRGSSQPRNQTQGLLHCRQILYQLSQTLLDSLLWMFYTMCLCSLPIMNMCFY